MKLKEKFEEYTDQKSWQKENYDAIECEVIADEFAIGFAEWLSEYTYKESTWRIYDKGDESFILKQLLEIYKKEKGL
jgi:cobalamin-dependent methionine synthase I